MSKWYFFFLLLPVTVLAKEFIEASAAAVEADMDTAAVDAVRLIPVKSVSVAIVAVIADETDGNVGEEVVVTDCVDVVTAATAAAILASNVCSDWVDC